MSSLRLYSGTVCIVHRACLQWLDDLVQTPESVSQKFIFKRQVTTASHAAAHVLHTKGLNFRQYFIEFNGECRYLTRMNNTQIRKKIFNWANELKRPAAISALVKGGLSPRTAEKMVAGTYKHRLRPSTLMALQRAGAIDG